MAYTLDASSCWAKLHRADCHIDQLRAEIATVTDENFRTSIPLVREYEEDARSVIVRIGKVSAVPQRWALVFGDAIHNLRAALDHLAWQLACVFYDSVPTDRRVIRNIQFPIVSDGTKWAAHPHTQHMRSQDRNVLKTLQPFARALQPSELNILASLAELSDADKHRNVHITTKVAEKGSFTTPGPEGYRDCVPDGRAPPNAPFNPPVNVLLFSPGPGDVEEGFKLCEWFVRRTGPDPDVDMKPSAIGYIAVNGNWNLLDCLNAIKEQVEVIIRKFDPQY